MAKPLTGWKKSPTSNIRAERTNRALLFGGTGACRVVAQRRWISPVASASGPMRFDSRSFAPICVKKIRVYPSPLAALRLINQLRKQQSQSCHVCFSMF